MIRRQAFSKVVSHYNPTSILQDKEKEKEKEKKKRKIRLEMHYDQVFLDGNDAYVWLYDPTPW